jgi:hypothetical protein
MCGGEGIEGRFKLDKLLGMINVLSSLERGGVSNGEFDRLGEPAQQVHRGGRHCGTFCMADLTKLFPSKASIVEKTEKIFTHSKTGIDLNDFGFSRGLEILSIVIVRRTDFVSHSIHFQFGRIIELDRIEKSKSI